MGYPLHINFNNCNNFDFDSSVLAARRLRGSRTNGQFVLRQQDPAALLAVGRYRQSLLTTVLVLPIAADDILSPALQQIDITHHG